MLTREGPHRTRRWTTLGAALGLTFGTAVVAAPSATAQAPTGPAPFAASGGLLGGVGDLLDGVLAPLGDALGALLGSDADDAEVDPLGSWLGELDADQRDATVEAITALADDEDAEAAADELLSVLDDAALAELVADDGPLDTLADADATGLITELLTQLLGALEDDGAPGGSDGSDGSDAPDGPDAPTGEEGGSGDGDGSTPTPPEGGDTQPSPDADTRPDADRQAGADRGAADAGAPGEAPSAGARDDTAAGGGDPGTAFAPSFAPQEDLDLEEFLDTSVVQPEGLEPFAADADGADGTEPERPEVEQDDDVPAATLPDPGAPVAPEAERERSPITAAGASAPGEDRSAPLIAAAAALTLATSLLVWQARRPTGRGAPG